MITSLALILALTTTDAAPQIAYLKYQGPAIYGGPTDPAGVPPSFTLAFECAEWVSCAKDYIVVIDGVRHVLAADQLQEVVPPSRFVHAFETPVVLDAGLHTLALIGRDGTTESPVSAPLTIRVSTQPPPTAPSHVTILKG